jgi:hypothetical protein
MMSAYLPGAMRPDHPPLARQRLAAFTVAVWIACIGVMP